VFSRKIHDPASFDFCNTIGARADIALTLPHVAE
jgi:hypothetical protein